MFNYSDFNFNIKLRVVKCLKHGASNSALKVGLAQMGHLDGQKLVAAKRLDDDVQSGHNGEGLGQEIAVLHQLILRNISKRGELLLVFRVLLEELEEDGWGDVTVLLGPLPGRADEVAITTTNVDVCTDATDEGRVSAAGNRGRRSGRGGHSRTWLYF